MRLSKLCCTLAVLAPVAFAAPCLAETPVETYASQTIQGGLALLNDKTMTDDARHAALRDFLKSTLDIKRIALFTLGASAQGASSADIDSYTKAFENFTLTSYVSRVGAYGGQTLKISDAVERAPGDFIVTVNVVDPAANASDSPDIAQFRVLKEDGEKFGVVDACVQGVWFEVAQRADVQGFLSQNGGNIAKLTEYLNQTTAQLSGATH